ncbi:helix-turn-helix domain-containing protein [Streptomyces sp. Qhu_M48]|uniref:helix-turn-helix domain-containing protein n=1 Tax=Streptomyces sp. Qhu_M48 TaxID=3435889 RepID=UPI003F4F4363
MPQPEKPRTPGTTPAEFFGYTLWKQRKKAGLSGKALGAKVQVTDDVIYRIEQGRYPSCQYDLAVRLDRFFETDVLTDAWPMAFGSQEADSAGSDADRTPDSVELNPVQAAAGSMLNSVGSVRTGSPDPMDRREFLHVAALAPLDVTHLLDPSRAELPTSVSVLDIHQVTDLATYISRMDNVYGGGGLVRDLSGQSMRWAISLLKVDCHPALRARLFAAVSRLGITVGASAFDAYAHDEATKTFTFAALCAEEARDWHLRAKAYSFLARQAIWIGEPDDGLTHAQKGLVRSDRLTATERAMLHTATARAWGKMGMVRETMQAVGLADEAFEDARPEEDPPWMAYYDEAQHAGDTAHALYDLVLLANQDPGPAARRFEQAVQGHGEQFKRSRAISRTKLASLTMAKADPREAAAIGHTALNEAGHLTSQRAIDDLRELARYAHHHEAVSEAAALHERIRATVRS